MLIENSDLMPLAVRATDLIRSTRTNAAARVRTLNALLFGVLASSLAAVIAVFVGLFFLVIHLINLS